MRLVLDTDPIGRTVLVARAEAGDTQPRIHQFVVDTHIDDVTVDQVAVAGTILFGRCASETIHLMAPVQSGVATACEAYLGTDGLVVGPSRPTEPKDLVFRDSQIILPDENQVSTSPESPRKYARTVRLVQLDGSAWAGRLVGMSSMSVASNGWLLDSLDGAGALRSRIALAVLLSRVLDASTIRVERPAGTSWAQLRPLGQLLAPLGIRLVDVTDD